MTLRFDVSGPDEDVPTILLSAGLGGLGRFWTPQIPVMSQGFRIITYDHRGTGSNRMPLADPYSVERMVEDVCEVLDHAAPGRSVHFVGHALGGLIGLALALASPGRLASLTLVNAWATLAPQTRRCFNARMALLAHGGPAAYLEAQPIFLYPAAWIADHEEQVAREIEDGLVHFQGIETLRLRVEAIRSFDMGPHLGAVRTRTLVVGAVDDVLVPVGQSERLSAIPGSRLWRTTGGHACTVVNPEEFNATLQAFLLG